ncbi:Amino-acid acetyltransferase, mitochondrial [Geranomyces michiganensis]|nr:Amino-acid acetyltransferase, mitochondrial [Geranomyces michiganensis]
MRRSELLLAAFHRRPRARALRCRLSCLYSSSTTLQSDPHPVTRENARQPASDRQFILDVLNAKPSQREARQFLRKFNPLSTNRQGGEQQFSKGELQLHAGSDNVGVHYRDFHPPVSLTQLGLVSLGHDVTDAQLVKFAATLVHLHKLGMTPLVVVENHGAGGTDKERRDSLLARVFRVVDLIDMAGARGMALYTGVFSQCDGPVEVDLGAINTALSLGHIPVLAPFARTHSQAATILQTCITLVVLSRALSASELPTPLKTIIVNTRGGLAPTRDSAISFVNLEDEYADVVSGLQDATTACTDDIARQDLRAMHNDLNTARKILDVLPSSSSAVIASVTSSAALISNLITDKPPNPASAQSMSLDIIPPLREPHEMGQRQIDPELIKHVAGRPAIGPTVLRHGLRVSTYTQPDWANKVDIARMSTLLERSFQKPLRPEAFWSRMHNVLHQIIVAGAYDGAAVVTHEACPAPTPIATTNLPPPIPYLDKFAVAPTSQGIGVADILWKQLRKRYPDLVWRSRANNPVNKWYFERCDGTVRLAGSQWQMFWYGSRGGDEVKAYAEMARAVPASFHATPLSA